MTQEVHKKAQVPVMYINTVNIHKPSTVHHNSFPH